METLGERIRYYRQQKGLTQRQLGDLVGASHNSVSDWENNKNKPYPGMIEKICGALEVDANTLLGWNNPEQMQKDADALANEILNNEKIKRIIPLIAKMSDSDLELVAELIAKLSK